jgi:raffinose/stachyose/melibiose transport system permease protein
MQKKNKLNNWYGWIFALPALIFYGVFNFYPLLTSVKLSFYKWDGIGPKTFVGLENYIGVFHSNELTSSLVHAFVLVIFFSFIPVSIALINASIVKDIKGKFFGAAVQSVLFLPQIIPGAASAVAWTWMYSKDGVVNQILSAVGLGHITRAWLGDFSFALLAVGLIGTWLNTGFCTLLLMSGIGKIDKSLYEAADIDGASAFEKFRYITLPGVKNEMFVATTMTTIGALASFDIVYMATGGGPGYQTMVPGVSIYRLAFENGQIGAASAMAIVLAVVIIIVLLPIRRLFKEEV